MKSVYTTFDIGRICHVYPTTVINWIKEGKLDSYATPGGHRRVRKEELLRFLRNYRIPIPPELKDSGGKTKVLVVDDDQDVREMLKTVLSQEKDMELQTVSTGFGAGAKITEWMPDLILLDFLMPDLDGFDVCRYLRENPKTAHIPVIAVTALTGEDDRRKIMACGANDYISKPFRNIELLEKINKHKKQRSSSTV